MEIQKISKYNHTPKSNATHFSQDGRKVSAHYFVDDNSIHQVVNDIDCS